MHLKSARVAIVYDKAITWGGAERVLLALHEIFPEAPLFTAVCDIKKAPWVAAFPRVETSFLQNLPFVLKYLYLYVPFMQMAFESFEFNNYDLVISVSSYDAKAIITSTSTCHVFFCLTPSRHLWSENGYEKFQTVPLLNSLIHFLKRTLLPQLRISDYHAASRPDTILTISKKVAGRIKKYYGRDSMVVYPFCEDIFFSSDLPVNETPRKSFYLLVSRLVPYKNIDIAIEAFNLLNNKKLIIIGDGPDKARLQKRAHNQMITFRDNVSDEELHNYYRECTALIMPQSEDFGICGLEAMACGKPIITYFDSGIAELINDGKHGIIFFDQTAKSLIQAINKIEQREYVFAPHILRRLARGYTKSKFKKHFYEQLKIAYKVYTETYKTKK